MNLMHLVRERGQASLVYVLISIVVFSLCPNFSVAQTVLCGNIIENDGTSHPVTDCADPFNVTKDISSPYTLTIDSKPVGEGDTVHIPQGGTNIYEINGNPIETGVQHTLYIHDGEDYRAISIEPQPPSEEQYRTLANAFFPSGTDIDPFVAAVVHEDDSLVPPGDQDQLWNFEQYVYSNYVPSLPKLEAGTYTLVSREFLLILNQNFWNKIFASVVPVAYAETSDNVFSLTFTIVEDPPQPQCCSSVVFLPGIKGSVLKMHGVLSDDTLWPPTLFSDDVSQLSLDSNGSSVNDIFVDGILNEYLSTPVYAPFSKFMDSLVASGTIAEWQSLPYDWRLSPESILDNGVETGSGTTSLLTTIEDVASRSRTGKVIIVAHSMGGLMGKEIIKRLQDEHKDDIVDSFIMVGSPQLGTPQAIGSILHGNGEGIPGDIEGVLSFLNNVSVEPAAARTLGQHMISAYNLLPSREYFQEVDDPVLKFDEQATFTEPWRNVWGENINSYNDYESFLTGEEVPRQHPDTESLNLPEVLDPTLFAKAQQYHDTYDTYTIPGHIQTVEIAGWGIPTMKGIYYINGTGGSEDYNPIFTREGDGVVVYSSAISSAQDEEYYLNLFDYNDHFSTNYSHKDLLSTKSTWAVLDELIKKKIVDSEFVTTSRPSLSDLGDTLVVSTHSPVVLEVKNKNGQVTGIDRQTETIKENIPGSSVSIFGHSEYIFVPQGNDYDFSYNGSGKGLTTVKIQLMHNDDTSSISTFSNIPTTEDTHADFNIEKDNTVKSVNIDIDGDGQFDASLHPDGSELSLIDAISKLELVIKSLDIKDSEKIFLLKKVDILKKVLEIKNQKIRLVAGNVDIGLINFEINVLARKGHITGYERSEIGSLLKLIKTQI